jgi:hypothetical protein
MVKSKPYHPFWIGQLKFFYVCHLAAPPCQANDVLVNLFKFPGVSLVYEPTKRQSKLLRDVNSQMDMQPQQHVHLADMPCLLANIRGGTEMQKFFQAPLPYLLILPKLQCQKC